MSKIILIGGPPRCGKTTLAQKISKQLNIPWISTGILGSIVREYIPEDKDQEFFPKNALRKKTGGGNDEMYSNYSAEEIVESYSKQAETVSEAIITMVDYLSAEDWDYIIEGYYVTPEVISNIKNKGFNIDHVILVNTNSDEIIDRCLSSEAKGNWVRDKTKNKETFVKIANMITLYSKKFIEDAKKFDVKFVDMGYDFRKSFDEVFVSLIK